MSNYLLKMPGSWAGSLWREAVGPPLGEGKGRLSGQLEGSPGRTGRDQRALCRWGDRSLVQHPASMRVLLQQLKNQGPEVRLDLLVLGFLGANWATAGLGSKDSGVLSGARR